ncbi:peptidase M23 domain-containing protein, partial [Thecamonas trahens ATCC 50062]
MASRGQGDDAEEQGMAEGNNSRFHTAGCTLFTTPESLTLSRLVGHDPLPDDVLPSDGQHPELPEVWMDPDDGLLSVANVAENVCLVAYLTILPPFVVVDADGDRYPSAPAQTADADGPIDVTTLVVVVPPTSVVDLGYVEHVDVDAGLDPRRFLTIRMQCSRPTLPRWSRTSRSWRWPTGPTPATARWHCASPRLSMRMWRAAEVMCTLCQWRCRQAQPRGRTAARRACAAPLLTFFRTLGTRMTLHVQRVHHCVPLLLARSLPSATAPRRGVATPATSLAGIRS